ncbi:MAG: pilus assembly protein [Microlunatus sp.]|nr:pilus assembly protein [Microlunatus sp.]
MARASSDRGSVSTWAVMFGVVAILLVGIAVDFGGRVVAQQEAADVARQSARAGGQPLDRASAMQGRGGSTAPEQGAEAAREYLAGYDGVTGEVSVVDGTSIQVTTRTTYQTKFLRIVGINELSATASATSRVVTVQEGTEQ